MAAKQKREQPEMMMDVDPLPHKQEHKLRGILKHAAAGKYDGKIENFEKIMSFLCAEPN